jgi:elongation factor P
MSSVYATNQFKKNIKLEIEGVPYQIVDFQHVSPGKGAAFTRTKLKNLLTQNVIEMNIKSGEKLPAANCEHKEMQYLYNDSEGYHFMDTTSFEQVVLSAEKLGDDVGFLQENLLINVLYYNERPITVELPTFVELKIVKTEPSFKGDTVTGGTKPAVLETGATVAVPFHISEGDIIKVDTRDSSYVEKVNK